MTEFPKEKLIQRIILTISIGLFIFSLSQNVYCVDTGCGDGWSGLAILITGWLGLALCPAGITWLANPIILFAWINFNKSFNRSLIASLIAFALSFSFLLFGEIIQDEAGNISPILGYQLGYWLWMSSSLIMVAGNILIYASSKRYYAKSLISHN